MVSVKGSPGLFSRTSLRTKSPMLGKGPIVSFGETTHEPVVVLGGVVVTGGVVVVVGGVVVAAGVALVGVSPLQADDRAALATPSRPRASRRLHCRRLVISDIPMLPKVDESA
jgi:hypothetical protein